MGSYKMYQRDKYFKNKVKYSLWKRKKYRGLGQYGV